MTTREEKMQKKQLQILLFKWPESDAFLWNDISHPTTKKSSSRRLYIYLNLFGDFVIWFICRDSCSHADFSSLYFQWTISFPSLLYPLWSNYHMYKIQLQVSGLPWVLGTYHPHFDLSKLASCTISCQAWVSWDLSLNVCVIIPSLCNEVLAS